MAASSEWMMLARTVLAFLFVVGLIFLSGAVARKFNFDKRFTGNKGVPRMGIVETLYLDPKHRLVMVRSDSREHLLLLGATGDLLIASHEIDAAKEVTHEKG
jgi:flagellar protein FliO/FliZ